MFSCQIIPAEVLNDCIKCVSAFKSWISGIILLERMESRQINGIVSDYFTRIILMLCDKWTEKNLCAVLNIRRASITWFPAHNPIHA